MKKNLALTLVVVLLLSLFTALPISAAEATKWDFDSGQGSWVAASKLNFDTSVQGILAVNITGTDASMTSTVNFPSTYNKIKIKMKNATSSTVLQVYFGTEEFPTIAGTRSKNFTVTANMAEYQDIVLDMSSLATWVGKIKTLRLDIADTASSGTVYIDSIEIVKESKVIWDFTSSAEGWIAQNKVSFDSPVNGALGINISGSDAYIFSPATDIDSRYNKVKIRLKNETSSAAFQLYFATNVVPTMSGATTMKAFTTETNMTEYKDFVFDMRSIAAWANFITKFRFDIADAATSGKFYIDRIQLLFDTTELQTKIAAAQNLNMSDYINGWEALQSALLAGQALVSDTNVTAAQADNAVMAIDNALAGLISASSYPANNEYVSVFSEGFSTALTQSQITSDWFVPYPSNDYMFAGDSYAKLSWTGSGAETSGTASVLVTKSSYQNYKLETTLKVSKNVTHSSALSLRNPFDSTIIGNLRNGDATIRPGVEGIIIVLSGKDLASNEFAIVFKDGTIGTKSEYVMKYPLGVDITVDTNITVYDLDDKVYIFVNDIPAARIEFTGLTGDSYTSGSVYNVSNELAGEPFSSRVIKRSGCVGYSLRGSNYIAVNDIKVSSVLNQTQTVANSDFDKTAWGTGNSAGNKAKVEFIAGDNYNVTLSVKVDKSLGRSTLELKNEAGTVVDSKKIDCFFVTETWVPVTLTVPSKGKYTLEITADGHNYSEIADIEFNEGLGATTAGNSIVFDGVVISEGGIS